MVSPDNKRKLNKNMTVDPEQISAAHKANLALKAKMDKTKTTPLNSLDSKM